ncbi:reverse transcriptase domain-containing protein [Candidatus Leptofilum sp.]|uniref:reverse transcriptase domain-containing protein n=1 Tax=Candidatus Leptofilum sp. TaxID=3241576 RepID=UPI003B5C7B65
MDSLLSKNPEELREQFLKLKTTEEVGTLLEVNHNQLMFNVYIRPKEERYKQFDISKRNGDSRTILAPNNSLKFIQRKLNEVLRCVYKPKASTHGFVLDKNIRTNATMHCRKKYVLNLDLKNFFPSITFKRVRGLFMAIPYELPEEVAVLLANICCHDRKLPQGAPTSPIISNLICSRLDTQLRQLAVRYRCVYTRYADDITFSTRQKNFPQDLAQITTVENKRTVVIGEPLKMLIGSNGFQINQNKVRLQTYDKRQEVTGLTVNKFPNVNKKFVSQIRAMLHAWEVYGPEEAEREFIEKWDKKNRNPYSSSPSFKYVVKGKIEFLGMVRGKDNPKYLLFLSQLASLDSDLVKETKDSIEYNRKHLIAIRQALAKHFSGSELRVLCFDLGINPENIERRGANLDDTILELVSHAFRNDQIEELVNAMRNNKPNLSFQSLSKESLS